MNEDNELLLGLLHSDSCKDNQSHQLTEAGAHIEEIDVVCIRETRVKIQCPFLFKNNSKPRLGVQLKEIAGLKKLKRGVGNELKPESMQQICLHIEQLRSRILACTCGDELPQLGYLVGLFKLGSDQQCCASDELELS